MRRSGKIYKKIIRFVSPFSTYMDRLELDNKIFEFTKCFCNLQLNFLKCFEVNSEKERIGRIGREFPSGTSLKLRTLSTFLVKCWILVHNQAGEWNSIFFI